MDRDNLWTKKNVNKMHTDDLVKFYNKTVAIIESYTRYDMDIPSKTQQWYLVIREELVKRGA